MRDESLNNRRTIKYIAFYSNEKDRYPQSLAAIDKINYVCEVLENAGFRVELLSLCDVSLNAPKQSYQGQLLKHSQLFLPKTYYKKNWLKKIQYRLLRDRSRLSFLNKHIDSGDIVLAYHSLPVLRYVSRIKKKKEIKCVLELEEVYSKLRHSNSNPKKIEKEERLINQCDAFLFSSEVLKEGFRSGFNLRPSAVINGVYHANRILPKNERLKRIVYAGGFAPERGVDAVIELSQYLPRSYSIHILGSGTVEETKRVINLISNVKSDSCCSVVFHGEKRGEEYTSFLQSCDIGICLQNPEDDFNKYEFPSKVFSYLSNGLYVVSTDIIQLQKSPVYDYITIAPSNRLEDVAKAIMSMNVDELKNPAEILEYLDKKAVQDIKQLMEGFYE